MTVMHTRARGTQAELFVARHLEHEGFTIITHNYHCRGGEIDLIARREDMLVFVEVKMRVTDNIDVGELVNVVKQKKIITAAHRYIAQHHRDEVSYRFDVACVLGALDQARVVYISDAFNDTSW